VTFSHFNRRLHLYLGLSLLPWLFMFAVTSVPFAHAPFFDRLDAAKRLPEWTLRFERTLDVPVPQDPKALRSFGADLLQRAGIHATSFGTYRESATQVNVYAYSLWTSTQLKYFIDQKRLVVEDHRFRWDQFLTGMHARGGFEDDGLVQLSWSVVVDLFCIAMILWIASGLYMWSGLAGHRGYGWLAILAGSASFLAFTFGL
jgi:hypothetical protein